MRLLVVDDDAVFREELAELLRDDRHEVTVSPSVAKALEELARGEFDAILSDLKMPRQGGLDLLREVRAHYPSTPLVVVTGFATVETAVAAMKAGAAEYVQKPFQVEQVRTVLRHLEEEARFLPVGDRPPTAESIARAWSSAGEIAVLRLSTRPARPTPGVTVLVPDLENPSAIREQVVDFLAEHPKAGVLLEDADRLLSHHRRADILAFLEDLRARLDGRGPLVVLFDPGRISATAARDLRAAVAGPETRLTLEALANPVRRSVLRRAADGPCSFTEALRAAGLEDSPKLAFHLRRLVDGGLLGHEGETYRITPKGREALALLAELDRLARHGNLASGAYAAAGSG
ncbi:MAG TPA: response regulator [Thermoplasmata archaeon]|nr:response regulator [Thermoplasmata archaeon]